MLEITLEAEDRFSLYTGVGSNDVPMPQRVIERTDFPLAPETSLGKSVPIIYGQREGAVSTLSAPIWKENYARGMRWATPWNITDGGRQSGINSNQWAAGNADIAAPGAPTISAGGVTATTGGQIPLNVIPWYNRFYIQCACQDPTGTWSEFFPEFAYDKTWDGRATTPDISVTSGIHYIDYTSASDDTKINVTFAWPGGATTGWKCRVWIGWNYYGIRWDQYIDVSHPATTCSFDKFGIAGGNSLGGTGRVASTGATLWDGWPGANNGYWFWTVRAYDLTGLGPESVLCIGAPGPYHPMYLEWNAVAGATGYRITQYLTNSYDDSEEVPDGGWGVGVTPLRYWDVGNVTSSSTIRSTWAGSIEGGLTTNYGIPVIAVGPLPDLNGTNWEAFIVCGHAVASIDLAYINNQPVEDSTYGGELAVPGHTGFTALFGSATYRDIGSERYTFVYARGTLADEIVNRGSVLSVAVSGIETIGDGTGTLLTDIFDQYRHWLEHWVLHNYQTGLWPTMPLTWGDQPYDVPIIDSAAFLAAKTIVQQRITGGYRGHVVIGAGGSIDTVRTWIARWNQSADCYSGFDRKSQYVVKVIGDDPALAEDAPVFSADTGILRDSFMIHDDVTAIENRITASYSRDWVTNQWQASILAEDLDVQATIGEIKPSTLELWAATAAGHAWDIAARRLARMKYPYRTVTWACDMGGFTLDLGDYVKVSHPDGLGPTGWTERPCFVIRHEFDPTAFTIQITALDLAFTFDTSLSTTELIDLAAFKDIVEYYVGSRLTLDDESTSDAMQWIGARRMLGA